MIHSGKLLGNPKKTFLCSKFHHINCGVLSKGTCMLQLFLLKFLITKDENISNHGYIDSSILRIDILKK